MAMDFPSGPTVGQIVPLGGNQYIWDGTAWNILPQQAPAALSDLPPANPAVGQFWWRGTNGQLYVYVNDGNSSQWVQAAGQGITPNTWETIPNAAGGALHVFTAQVNYQILDLGAFRKFRIAGIGTPVSSSYVGIQVSADNGATWKTAGTDYGNQYMRGRSTGLSGANANSASMPMSVSTDAGTRWIFSGTIEEFNKSGACGGLFNSGLVDVAVPSVCEFYSFTNINGPFNALRLMNNTGVAMTGTFTLEGVRG